MSQNKASVEGWLGPEYVAFSAFSYKYIFTVQTNRKEPSFPSLNLLLQAHENALTDKSLLHDEARKQLENALTDGSLSRRVARKQLALIGPFGAGKSNLGMNFIKPGFKEDQDSTPGVSLLHTTAVISI